MTDRSFSEFQDIPMFRYDFIMADPPWSFKTYSAKGQEKSASSQYSVMDGGAINSIPVGSLASPDCLLWLWVTNPMLREGIACLEAWGFTFKTAGHWVKRGASGKLAFGTGYVLRSAGEPFLIGAIGKPKTTRSVRSVVEGPRREHSRKPDEAYAAAQALMPNAKRLDLFAREKRQGWDTFGNEAEKFGAMRDDSRGD